MTCAQQIIQVQCHPLNRVQTKGSLIGDGTTFENAIDFDPSRMSASEALAWITAICESEAAMTALRDCVAVKTTYASVPAAAMASPQFPPALPRIYDSHWETAPDGTVSIWQHDGAGWRLRQTLGADAANAAYP